MEEIIKTHFVDVERSKNVRLALTKAYASNDANGLKNAVLDAQKYADEGGDFEDWRFGDDIEDYNGDDADMLAEKYLVRLLHDRTIEDDDDPEYIDTGIPYEKRIKHTIRCIGKSFTSDEWSQYCNESRIDPAKRIVTTIGKYIFNDCDVCLNPTVMSLVISHGSNAYECMLEWCDCGNGIWSCGLRCTVGNGGLYGGCSWTDRTTEPLKGYHSEREAKVAACDHAISYIESTTGVDNNKRDRLLAIVKDFKKSISKPVQLSLFEF